METWKQIPGLDYDASDQGRLRSHDRRFVDVLGRPRFFPAKVLRPTTANNGYLIVTVHKAGRQMWKTVHTLILEAFRGPRPSGQLARHLNDVRSDNRLVNLCWGTPKENCVDRKRNRPDYQVGSKNSRAKLTEQDVLEMRRLRRLGVKNKDIARQFKVTQGTASEAIHGSLWSHVNG